MLNDGGGCGADSGNAGPEGYIGERQSLVFARYLEPGALVFLRELNLNPRERLLDVACGAGQIVIPASRSGIDATGVDIAANHRTTTARGTGRLPTLGTGRCIRDDYLPAP